MSETTDYSSGKKKSIIGENRRQRRNAGLWSDLRNHRVGSNDQTGVLGQISQNGKAPEGAGRLALIFPLPAFEDDLLATGDVGNPLRLTFPKFGLASLGIDFGPVTHTEVDIVQSLGQRLEVLLGGIVARPHVEVHDDAGGTLDALDMNEDDIFFTDLDGLGSELHIADIARIEVQGSDIVDIVDLREIDISHDD